MEKDITLNASSKVMGKNKKENDKNNSKIAKKKQDSSSDANACFLASGSSLSDWSRPEEDEAWTNI